MVLFVNDQFLGFIWVVLVCYPLFPVDSIRVAYVYILGWMVAA